MNIIEKLEKMRVELGPWQHGLYSRMKNQIRELVARIYKLINGPNTNCNADMLKTTCFKLGHLYAKEKCYGLRDHVLSGSRKGIQMHNSFMSVQLVG